MEDGQESRADKLRKSEKWRAAVSKNLEKGRNMTGRKGFASMDRDRLVEISRKGGKAKKTDG